MTTRRLVRDGLGIVWGCLLAGLTVFSAPIYANQVFVSDPSNTTVSGSADFTTGAGTVSVTLTNTFANIQSLAQLLSDISFSVSGGTDVTSPSVMGSWNLIT